VKCRACNSALFQSSEILPKGTFEISRRLIVSLAGLTPDRVDALVWALTELTIEVCVPKTLSVLIGRRSRLTSAQHERTAMFRSGHLGIAIQVEEPT
jgi:hypothetical protein